MQAWMIWFAIYGCQYVAWYLKRRETNPRKPEDGEEDVKNKMTCSESESARTQAKGRVSTGVSGDREQLQRT
jgi:hypothetical protein